MFSQEKCNHRAHASHCMLFNEQSLLHNPQGQKAAFFETFILRLGMMKDFSYNNSFNNKMTQTALQLRYNMPSVKNYTYEDKVKKIKLNETAM